MKRKTVLKKMFALALTGAMAMSTLTGCGSSAQNDGQSSAAGTTAAGTSEAGSTSTESGEKEKLVIAIQTYSNITDYEDNYLTHMLEDALDVDVEFYLLSADSAEAQTQLSLMVSANQSDLPGID